MRIPRLALTVVLLLFAVPCHGAEAGMPNGAAIDMLTGTKGQATAEGIYKVLMPRSDLKVTVTGATITPPMGLTSWAAFKKGDSMTMVMGDIVLQEDQVDAVMDTALDVGLQVTALHNHFAYDFPRIMFMHIAGTGPETVVASAVGRVFSIVRATAGGPKPARIRVDSAESTLTPCKLERILGKGEYKDGVFKVAFGRTTKMNGMEAGKDMGINTWAAFAGADEEAVVDGDFAMAEGELQEVLKTLRKAGISVVAIHNHMIMEEPRIMFLHFWGKGKAEKLAEGVKEALGKTAVGR